MRPLLDTHEMLRRFIPQLLNEAVAECRERASEQARVPARDHAQKPGPLARLPPVPLATEGYDEVAAARERRMFDAETVVISLASLTQDDMTGSDAAV